MHGRRCFASVTSSLALLIGVGALLWVSAGPAHAVNGPYKVSDFGGVGVQIWFEAEDFDERCPPGNANFPVTALDGAFGGVGINRNGEGNSVVRYTFDIGAAGGVGGELWYFWARVVNPGNRADYLLVSGDPADEPLPMGDCATHEWPSGNEATWDGGMLSNDDDRVFETDTGAVGPPHVWGWAQPNHEEGHTKQLQDGVNTMHLFSRESADQADPTRNKYWDIFMWTNDPDYVPTDEDYVAATMIDGPPPSALPTVERSILAGLPEYSCPLSPGDLVTIGIVGTAAEAPPSNLLANGGFEDGVLEPWITYDNVGGLTATVVTELAGAAIADGPIEGSSALEISVPEPGAANSWDAGLKQSTVLEEGKVYTLSAFLKTQQGEMTINFKPEQDFDPFTGYGEMAFTFGEEWTEFSITTPPMPETVDPASATFHLLFGPGVFWMDDVQLSELGADGDGGAELVLVSETVESTVAVVSNVSNGGTVAPSGRPFASLEDAPENELRTRTVVQEGAPAPQVAEQQWTHYDAATGIYTQSTQTGQDIWEGGDTLEYAYTKVSGDFDFSIEWVEKSGGGGQWGKFGPMARWSLHGLSRMAMTLDTLNTVNDQRMTGRNVHEIAGAGNMFENFTEAGATSGHSPYARLKRVGNIVSAWFSDTTPADPTDDANWVFSGETDWGAEAPAEVFLGYGSSDHIDGGAEQIITRFKILNLSADEIIPQPPSDPLPEFIDRQVIEWQVTRDELLGGVTYDLTLSDFGSATLSGEVTNAETVSISGVGGVDYLEQAGPVGDFATGHMVGRAACDDGVPTITFDEGTGLYTQSGCGIDVWTGGDEIYFAYTPTTGDFVATMRITDRFDPPGSEWGKHGIMARQECTGNARHMSSQTQFGEANIRRAQMHGRRNNNQNDGSQFEHRWQLIGGGGGPDPTVPPDGPVGRIFDVPDPNGVQTDERPPWQALIRDGAQFSVFMSDSNDDGTPRRWVLMGTEESPDMPDTVLLGAYVNSHAGGTIAEMTYAYEQVALSDVVGGEVGEFQPIEALSADYDTEGDGDAPANAIVNVGAGLFSPQVQGGRLRITEDFEFDSAVSVLYATEASTADLAGDGFTAEFDVVMGTGDDAPADVGDGITFVAFEGFGLLGSGAVGEGGGSLGFGGAADTSSTFRNAFLDENRGSLAVEFDTWSEGTSDPADGGTNQVAGGYHVGVDSNGQAVSAQHNQNYGVTDLPNIFDAGGVHVRIDYTPRVDSFATVDVYLNDTQVVGALVGALAAGSDLLVGFTGGTSGNTLRAEVDNLVVTGRCFEAIDGATVEASAMEAGVGEAIELTATVTGVDGTAVLQWGIVDGPGEIDGADDGEAVSVVGTAEGEVTVRLIARDDLCGNQVIVDTTVSYIQVGGLRLPGDANDDGAQDLSDAVKLLRIVFQGEAGPCDTPEANAILTDWDGESTGSESVDALADALALLEWEFQGGAAHSLGLACTLIFDCSNQAACE